MASVDEIYGRLKAIGLCDNQMEFSERWLGRSPGYFAWLRSTGAECCTVSLQLLADRLFKRAEQLLHPVPPSEAIAKIMALRELREDASRLAESALASKV